ncbi:TBC1 domain protein, putative [Trichomonas vaginalis G3]|uniref:TBC1 domain protein, putative n=1 Tax=Trichomonas vaginalis (strain ATCC PRA-98 / G3) TaxID=412133 RepID=A2DYB9_TRIV3|nr:regulation of vesicle fusion [Trichomonas vaginalis G3]EAY14596.1 TBC1 domain protein, putative [Trichomonas vaginalis G3]KAI5526607.1 regulation of vesicle fusion [Trichomonas vaginalis G3]|eukprot:XP_001326819.1 TBC1 domain protein [Trichomonas vaginalis G3]
MSKEELEFVIMPMVQPNPDDEPIDVRKIREIALTTLTEYPPEDRALAWLVLLDVFPTNPNKWEEVRKTYIDNYWNFVEDLKVKEWHNKVLPEHMLPEEYDVPNKQLMSQIHCDIVRTGRQILFFPPEPVQQDPDHKDIMAPFQKYMRRIERVLYIFGTFNIGLSYTQGFNELVSPLYYVMLKATALFRNNHDIIEALSFTMLQQLITSTQIHEMYTTQDKSSIILHKLGEFTHLVEKYLPEIALKLKTLNVHPAVYCYRWYNLLFAQEYDMPSLLLIWDVIFAHKGEMLNFAFYIGLAQLKVIEKRLQSNDFSIIISALQQLDIMDVVPVIKWASYYYKLDHQKQSSVFSGILKLFE